MIEWHISCGSFAVKSESIGMGNVRIVQTVFLTRPTVKHTRSSADTDKSVRRVYVRDGPDRPIRSRIPDIGQGAVRTKMFDFKKFCDLDIYILSEFTAPTEAAVRVLLVCTFCSDFIGLRS